MRTDDDFPQTALSRLTREYKGKTTHILDDMTYRKTLCGASVTIPVYPYNSYGLCKKCAAAYVKESER